MLSWNTAVSPARVQPNFLASWKERCLPTLYNSGSSSWNELCRHLGTLKFVVALELELLLCVLRKVTTKFKF